MLDRFLIFTKTGVVLWSMTMLPPDPAAGLGNAALDASSPTTCAVNSLVRDVLIPARGGGSVGVGAGGNSMDTPDYTIQWTTDNGTDTVFAAVIPRQFAPLVTYVGTLLASVRKVFVDRFGERILAAGDAGTDGRPFEFRGAFEKLLDAAEASASGGGLGGGSGMGPGKRGAPVPPPAAAATTPTSRDSSSNSNVRTPETNKSNGASASSTTAGAGSNDADDSNADDSEFSEFAAGGVSASAVALARAKLAARNKGGSAAKGSASKGGKGGGGSAEGTPGSAKKGKSSRSWDDFSYSRDKESGLDKSKDRAGEAGASGGSDGIERVTYSGTGASGSGKNLADGDEEDWDLDADSIVANAASEAAGGGSGKGAGSTGAGKAGIGSWLSHTRVGTFLTSLAGTKVLDRADLEPVIDALKQQLISKNVNSDVAQAVCESVAGQLEGKKLEAAGSVEAAFTSALRSSCERLLTPRRPVDVLAELRAKKAAGQGPYVIVFVGINGVGKSTSLSKVAFHLRDHGHSVLIAACDSFRAGAVEQLKRHCTALDVPLFQQGYAKDPVTIASAAIKEATDARMDCVLVDTAGRMQNNGPLMQQLAKLVAVNKPDLVLMVAEALVGSDGVDQLTSFDRALVDYAVDRSQPRRIDGVLLTKFDTVDDKVGAALSMVYVTGIPVVYLGTGQKYQDLRKLNVGGVVKALLA